jgi:hypothetical protein
MTRRAHSLASATLVELLLVGSIIAASWLMNTGCATWADAVRPAEDIAHALCLRWVQAHPEIASADPQLCDHATGLFTDAVNLATAKPTPKAISDALAAHPPLLMPCVDLKNPYQTHEGE